MEAAHDSPTPPPRVAMQSGRALDVMPPRGDATGTLIAAAPLVYRTIDLDVDRAVILANYRDTAAASYGADARCPVANYLAWLKSRIEEFPDGHVLAWLADQCVGQLELQVPYGLSRGYVNLFCVTPAFRGKGYARRLHDYAQRYFRSWEADTIELHVSQTNVRAIGFYRHMGYRVMGMEKKLWKMTQKLITPADPPQHPQQQQQQQ
jgi:ribosomal protein S18 acetylase RimI-like enzyme